MAETFLIIRRLVIANNLNAGFTRRQIVELLPNGINQGTVRTFIGKHSINGGNVNVLYFTRIAHGLYVINPEFMN